MARLFPKKIRNKVTRKQKPLLLIIAEGKNVTESQYFKSFQKQHSGFNIQMLTPGNITDPAGMQRKILQYWKDKGLDEKQGDIAFIVLDLDCSAGKAQLIKKLAKRNDITKFVVSNPCFEVWFLLHFRYSTHAYASSAEAVRDLKKHIPGYEKNIHVAPIIADNLETAMDNAKKLKEYFDGMNAEWPSEKCNPRTDVPVVIDVINKFILLSTKSEQIE